MKDRHGSFLRLWLLVPLVVVLHLGIFRLATHRPELPQRSDAPAMPVAATAEKGTGPFCAEHSPGLSGKRCLSPFPLSGSSPAVDNDSPLLLPSRKQPHRWLPPLTDQTRALLTSFRSSPEQTSAAFDEPGPELGCPGPADATGTIPSVPGWKNVGVSREAASSESGCARLAVPADSPATAAPVEGASGPSLLETVQPAPGLQWGEPIRPPAPEGRSQSTRASSTPIDRSWGAPRGRSVQLEKIARQADMHSRRAFELAGRGACFSARAQFIMALRLVAQGLDRDYPGQAHGRALAMGLTALKEAEDFLPVGSRLEASLNVPAIIAGHGTPALKDVSPEEITPFEALQRYLTFAQEQLAVSMQHEVAGSAALQGLGKLHGALDEGAMAGVKAARPKAVVFYQAALLVDPRNFMASNDLGVLLARAGHYDEARIALSHGLSIQSHATGWRNLAVVHRQLGQIDPALEAAKRWQTERRAEIAKHQGLRPEATQQVRWVTPGTFGGPRATTAEQPRKTPASATSSMPAPRQASRYGRPFGWSNY